MDKYSNSSRGCELVEKSGLSQRTGKNRSEEAVEGKGVFPLSGKRLFNYKRRVQNFLLKVREKWKNAKRSPKAFDAVFHGMVERWKRFPPFQPARSMSDKRQNDEDWGIFVPGG